MPSLHAIASHMAHNVSTAEHHYDATGQMQNTARTMQYFTSLMFSNRSSNLVPVCQSDEDDYEESENEEVSLSPAPPSTTSLKPVSLASVLPRPKSAKLVSLASAVPRMTAATIEAATQPPQPVLQSSKGKRRAFTFTEEDLKLLMKSTEKFRQHCVSQYETSGTMSVTAKDVMNALIECGGLYCDLAYRFKTEVNGQRRLADRVRHEIFRELVKLKLKPPKRQRQAADENEEENEDT